MVSVLFKRLFLFKLVAFALLQSTCSAFSNALLTPFHSVVLSSVSAQEAWIRDAQIKLESIKEFDHTSKVFEPIETKFDGFYRIEFRIKEFGFIQLHNSDWVCFISHSTHSNKEIGDLTMAKDNQGRFYINYGHICGGVVSFKSNEFIQTLSANVFFEKFVSGTDSKRWLVLDKI